MANSDQRVKEIKVLIVDDEPGIRKLVSDILCNDFETVVADSTPNALQMVEQAAPHLVLSDVKMPGPDGLALLREMGKLHPKIPVILMTGHGDKEIVVEALRNNVFDYLEKPFVDEELVNTLKRATDFLRVEKELAMAQLKMLHSSKMAALGEMAGGIAHEINTPLGTIGLISDQIHEMAEEGEMDQKMVGEMTQTVSDTVKRIGVIIQGLRAFSRDSADEPFISAPVRKIVEDTMSLCREKVKHANIQVQVAGIPDHLKIQCRPVQISQVLLNLINNACDAISNLPEKWIKLGVENQNGSVQISVTDSGKGIPEKVRNRIFQPFFTTKEIGKGTGLGLSVSKGIIESHQGSLNIDTHNQNTRFVIQVPIDGKQYLAAHTKKAA